MTQIVIDASVALAWSLSTQKTSAADALRTLANVDFVAPYILHFEVRNGLRKAERDKRISRAGADQALIELETIVDVLDQPDRGLLSESMLVSRTFGLTFYDAAYVELARRIGCTLATRDSAIVNIASPAGVSIYDAR